MLSVTLPSLISMHSLVLLVSKSFRNITLSSSSSRECLECCQLPAQRHLIVCEEKVQGADSKHKNTGLGLRGTALCGVTLLGAVLKTSRKTQSSFACHRLPRSSMQSWIHSDKKYQAAAKEMASLQRRKPDKKK